MRCYIELIVPEDKRKRNRKICKNISGVLLLTGFQAHTAHGKVISYELRNQPLDDFHRDEDHRTHSFYVITSIVKEPIIYLSSSNLGRDVVKYLRDEEVLSLPQIDFSDYVNEILEIVQNPLFIEICENQYRIKREVWSSTGRTGRTYLAKDCILCGGKWKWVAEFLRPTNDK
jgi:hypothetical protein